MSNSINTSTTLKYVGDLSTVDASTLSDGDIVYNQSNNTIAISSSGTLNTISDLTGYVTTNASTLGYYDTYPYYSSTIDITDIFSVLTEEEIKGILKILYVRKEKTDFNRILKKIVSNGSFSEDFLMEYIDCLDKDVVFINHKRQIMSGEYPTLAALYALQ